MPGNKYNQKDLQGKLDEMETDTTFMDWKTQHWEDVTVLKMICRFIGIPTKIWDNGFQHFDCSSYIQSHIQNKNKSFVRQGLPGGSVDLASDSWSQLRSWSQDHEFKPHVGLCVGQEAYLKSFVRQYLSWLLKIAFDVFCYMLAGVGDVVSMSLGSEIVWYWPFSDLLL